MRFAGGLRLAGFRPFIHTFGVFMYRRPYDQIVGSITNTRRMVRLRGFLPGVTTLENHVTNGGIGSRLAETLADAGIGKRLVRLVRLELRDTARVEDVYSLLRAEAL